MAQKTFVLISSVIFAIIALGHLSCIVLKWSVFLEGWAVPVWVSWIALIVSAYLASEGFRLARKS
jgi:hypothetical protein